ncbi:MAG: hypothetical protein EBU81_06570, partial [Proteobacteria bacterium]|nr:hypothetical protein [Pseudomonadota bacterium]
MLEALAFSRGSGPSVPLPEVLNTRLIVALDRPRTEAQFTPMHPQLPTPILESLKASTRRRFLQ